MIGIFRKERSISYFAAIVVLLITTINKLEAQVINQKLIGEWSTDSVWIKSTNMETDEVTEYRHSFRTRSISFNNPPTTIRITPTELTAYYLDGNTEQGLYKCDDINIRVDVPTHQINYKYILQTDNRLLLERHVNTYVTDGMNPTKEEHYIYLQRKTN